MGNLSDPPAGPGSKGDASTLGPASGENGEGLGAGDTPGGPSYSRCDNSMQAAGNPVPGPALVRRLTRWEYNNTVRDLLGDTTRPAKAFVAEEESGGFNNNAEALTVSALLAEQYLDAAEDIAARATTDLQSLLGCAPDDACVRAFVTDFGERAYRRPLTADEQTRLLALFDDGRQAFDAKTGVEWLLQAMLQSPHFLYRVERGEPLDGVPGVAALSSWELASRLSYFLLGTLPDEELLQAARADALRTQEQIETQARRLLADPRARETVHTFHAQWLDLDLVDRLEKDTELFAEFDDAVRSSMRGEIERFIDDVIWRGGGDAKQLLTAPYTFVDAELADLYGVSAPSGEGFQRIELDPTQRAGLLTLPGILALGAKSNQTSPIHRGLFVREKLLCMPLPPPPPGIVVEAPDPDPSLTTRERFAQHASDPACSGCHQLMDPIGVGFENYDAIGRWRSEENGLAIDSAGEVVSSDLPGSFNGAVELAQQLADSKQAQDCIVRQWFRYAYGRLETNADACTLEALSTRFAESGHDVRELLVELTLTDAFRYRSMGGDR